VLSEAFETSARAAKKYMEKIMMVKRNSRHLSSLSRG